MGLRKLQADRLGFEMTTAAHEPEPPRHTQGSTFRLESFSTQRSFSRLRGLSHTAQRLPPSGLLIHSATPEFEASHGCEAYPT
jgi:hypothetical protein